VRRQGAVFPGLVPPSWNFHFRLHLAGSPVVPLGRHRNWRVAVGILFLSYLELEAELIYLLC